MIMCGGAGATNGFWSSRQRYVEYMTTKVTLRTAQAADAETLAAISQRAFDSDVEVGAPDPGGPPGYDEPQWQQQMMRTSDYHALCVDGCVIGGAIVCETGPGERELQRLFIDPVWHGCGIGLQAMALLMEHYPHSGRWTLDTPAWNPRTRGFYERLGFVEYGRRMVGDGFELVLFEKPDAAGR